jgi:protein-disulfide isomerase
MLFGALLASLVSVALFAISKFLIGAYCLLCLGLYAINLLLLAIAWFEHRKTGFVNGVVEGAGALWGFVKEALAGRRAHIRGLMALILVAVLSASLPQIVYALASRLRASPTAQLQPDVAQFCKEWQEAPVSALVISEGSGAFKDYSKGELSAPIQIVEFADFECPGCRMTYVGMESLLKEYEGQYRLVFKNYPLDSACNPGIRGPMHTMACFASHFTRCAGEQGKFWGALDFVFTDPVLEDVEDTPSRKSELLERGSKTLGLDQQAVEECINSERYLEKIRSDIKEGNQLGLESTPSFWVNGKKVARPSHAVFSKIFSTIIADEKRSAQAKR